MKSVHLSISIARESYEQVAAERAGVDVRVEQEDPYECGSRNLSCLWPRKYGVSAAASREDSRTPQLERAADIPTKEANEVRRLPAACNSKSSAQSVRYKLRPGYWIASDDALHDPREVTQE